MKNLSLTISLSMMMALNLRAGGAEAKNPYLPPAGLPGDLNELADACYGIPALADFSRLDTRDACAPQNFFQLLWDGCEGNCQADGLTA